MLLYKMGELQPPRKPKCDLLSHDSQEVRQMTAKPATVGGYGVDVVGQNTCWSAEFGGVC